MSKKDNLQEADGINKITPDTSEESSVSEKTNETQTDTTESETINEEDETDETANDIVNDSEDHVEAVEKENAEDAEDASNEVRHKIKAKDYHSMNMDLLVLEFEKLLKSDKVQTIKAVVDEIKNEFNSKYNELLEQKKEEFLADGGSEIDFYFTTPLKKQFNSLFKDYKNNLNAYYKDLESSLKKNLEKRLNIIEKIKGLLNVEENISSTYKHFKELQDEWRNAGPIPRDKYNNAWNTYHHHVERFYDFLHLNRDLRDLDFKHNLDQKLKIIEQAEALAEDTNVNRSFRELQALHKLWKEDLGPVAKEKREEIWQRFSKATKVIHEKKQEYYEDLDKAYEKNLIVKEEIISKITEIASQNSESHKFWQQKIREIEALRTEFFNAGKVPLKLNEATWAKFKEAVRQFNRNKNSYYKNLKKSQTKNLRKKLELIKIAEDNKDSDDFGSVTPLMKKIQSDWKKIGHVPRKDSDKIWKQFKAACNAYFDRMNTVREQGSPEQVEAFNKKTAYLKTLKSFKLEGNNDEVINVITDKINEWKSLGNVARNKKQIEHDFKTIINGFFDNLGIEKEQLEMIKFQNKINAFSNQADTKDLDNELNFIRKKIDEIKSEINQLENNLQFFSNASEDNPLVKEVNNKIEKSKKTLETWKKKYQKIKKMYS